MSIFIFHLYSFIHFVAKFHIVAAGDHEEAGYHHRLGLRALALVLGGLETFVGIPRETVQVEAVVPVGTSDEWKAVRTEVLDDVIERHPQMLHERYLGTWLVVEGNGFIEN